MLHNTFATTEMGGWRPGFLTTLALQILAPVVCYAGAPPVNFPIFEF